LKRPTNSIQKPQDLISGTFSTHAMRARARRPPAAGAGASVGNLPPLDVGKGLMILKM
jgi:hypothetical protein